MAKMNKYGHVLNMNMQAVMHINYKAGEEHVADLSRLPTVM